MIVAGIGEPGVAAILLLPKVSNEAKLFNVLGMERASSWLSGRPRGGSRFLGALRYWVSPAIIAGADLALKVIRVAFIVGSSAGNIQLWRRSLGQAKNGARGAGSTRRLVD